MASKFRCCYFVPEVKNEDRYEAALYAIRENPVNAPAFTIQPDHIAAYTQKMWSLSKVKDLTFGFMDSTTTAMRDKITLYANKWSSCCAARFHWSNTDPDIRIAFERGGYYSYLGTDCHRIPKNQHTMNLEGFTTRTPDEEWERVVVHEFGHALAFPHEHQKKEIIDLLDYPAVIEEYRRRQGWSEQETRQQVFISLNVRSLTGASPADPTSIMCYSFPARLTKNRVAIPGGRTISAVDKQYAARIYPDSSTPPPPDRLSAEQAIEAIKAVIARVQ